MTATALASLQPALAGAEATLVMRSATPADARVDPGADRAAPRERPPAAAHESEIAGRAERFLVIVDDDVVAGCAELAPLSASVAEVRSLVLDDHLRGMGLGRLLVDQLTREAKLAGFRTICAFTHEPGIFARLGFSLVPHAWLPEKIGADCAGCALFRRCGQSAMRLRLDQATAGLGACA